MSVRIITGDALTVLRTLESESVQTCVTSPPYFGLRDYGVDGQIGLEQKPAEFIARLVEVFDEVRRVLRHDGTCWVNLGDSYAGSGKGPTGHNGIGDQGQRQGFTGGRGKTSLFVERGDAPEFYNEQHRTPAAGIPAKNLLLIPERFAIAMQEAGWWVRSRIAWCKTSAMPESVRDRPTSAWEHIFLFSKSRNYFWDAEAVRQPYNEGSLSRYATPKQGTAPTRLQPGRDATRNVRENGIQEPNPAGANLRNFWLLGPAGFTEAHFATFPPELPRRCILAGTSAKGACPACGAPWRRLLERLPNPKGITNGAHREPSRPEGYEARSRDYAAESQIGRGATMKGWEPGCSCDAGDPVPCVVLDPFGGAGTTAMVADRNQRNAISIELNPVYAQMSRNRIEGDAGPMFADVAVS